MCVYIHTYMQVCMFSVTRRSPYETEITTQSSNIYMNPRVPLYRQAYVNCVSKHGSPFHQRVQTPVNPRMDHRSINEYRYLSIKSWTIDTSGNTDTRASSLPPSLPPSLRLRDNFNSQRIERIMCYEPLLCV